MQDNYTPGSYSLVFATDEDYRRALTKSIKNQKLFGYSDFDHQGLELFWHSKAKRDKAIRILDKEYGISVDWFDFV